VKALQQERAGIGEAVNTNDDEHNRLEQQVAAQ